MIKRFTAESRIKDVFENPIGSDLMRTIMCYKKFDKKFFKMPLTKNMKLKNLVKHTKGAIDDEFVKLLCDKLNAYAREIVIPGDTVKEAWWKEAVVYQIYPRSFMDSNDDGVGDLQGIRSKLNHLEQLGVDVIWICPFYDSPNKDNGYDVRDYQAIMKEFGTMDDFDQLLEDIHGRGMKLIIDLVMNHTSDQHEWFQKALQDKNSYERDYYIFREGKEGGPPNNWSSVFWGAAWDPDENSAEWYLHTFSKNQPDLNWANPNLRHHLYQIVNWWLDKGVDGFRLDVINYIAKGNDLPDGNPIVGGWTNVIGMEHYTFNPTVHQYLREMNMNTFANHDVMTVGETASVGLEISRLFSDESRNELNMVFHFGHLDMPGKSRFEEYDYDLNYYKQYILPWQTELGRTCRQTLFYNNHDNPRMLSKISKDYILKDHLAKMLALLQLTLSGTPFIYQGDEIGMINSVFNKIEDFRDVDTINLYHELKDTMPEDELIKKLNAGTRDHARTPMQWDETKYAGFSQHEPWIAVNPDHIYTNVKESVKNENSIFHFYRQMIAIRRNAKALIYGDFIPVRKHSKNVFAYFKEYQGEKYFIEINMTDKKVQHVTIGESLRMVFSNYDYHNKKVLLPYEANLFQVVDEK